MQLTADPAEDRRRWRELPAFYRFMPVTDPKPAVRPLLVERDLGSAVLSESRVGAGRAFFFGANETWRWRVNVAQRDQDQFWSQLIRYACEEPYAVHDGPIALSADPVVAAPGQPIRIRAKVLEASKARSIVPTLLIRAGDATVRTQVLLPAGSIEAGRFETMIDDLADGDYEFRLAINDASTASAIKVWVHDNFSAEMANISGDEARLGRIASENLSIQQK